jgi:hypothetical protein
MVPLRIYAGIYLEGLSKSRIADVLARFGTSRSRM